MATAEPVPLDLVHVEDAAGVLLRSFADDPGLCFVLPDASDRDRLGPSLARAVVHYAVRCGAPLVTPDVVRGVALWFPPDAPALTDGDLAETGLAAVPEQIGPAGWRRFKRLLDHIDALHPRLAPEPHWYLAMLGVDPSWQRQGLGEALMRPVFATADRDGVSCYLEAPSTCGNRCPRQQRPRLADAAGSGSKLGHAGKPVGRETVFPDDGGYRYDAVLRPPMRCRQMC